jgi:hypothetical protein
MDFCPVRGDGYPWIGIGEPTTVLVAVSITETVLELPFVFVT